MPPRTQAWSAGANKERSVIQEIFSKLQSGILANAVAKVEKQDSTARRDVQRDLRDFYVKQLEGRKNLLKD